MNRRLRFGVLCNSLSLQAWQAETVARLTRLDDVECVVVVMPAEGNRKKKKAASSPKSVFRYLNVAKWIGGDHLWKRLSKRLVRNLDALQSKDVDGVLGDLPVLRYSLEKHPKAGRAFSAESVEAIREYDLDFIMCFSIGIIRGDILEATRFGLWSFHHGDETLYRGSPAAFWEIVDGSPVTGAILQRLTDRLDAGIILHKGYFETKARYASSLNAVLWGCVSWPARVAAQLASGDTTARPESASSTMAPIRYAPTNAQFLKFAARSIFHRAAKHIRSVFFEYRETWNVGVVSSPIHEVAFEDAALRVHWMAEETVDRFAADPFGMVDLENHPVVLYEDFDYRHGRGVISAAKLDDNNDWERLGKVLDYAPHLSYPYLFESNGDVFCIAESSSIAETWLLRAVEFPNRWDREVKILDGVELVDPTVFRHDDRWWLVASIKEDCGQRTDSLSLFAWHADSLTGAWEPHRLNPLKTDVRGARPAGTPFVRGERLYRPGQDCSETYGGRIRVYEVLQLTPNRFHEREVRCIEPPTEFPDGIHTIAKVGDQTLIDAKRCRYVLRGGKEIARRLFSG